MYYRVGTAKRYGGRCNASSALCHSKLWRRFPLGTTRQLGEASKQRHNVVKSPLRTKYQEKAQRAQRAQRFELNQWQFDAEHPQRIWKWLLFVCTKLERNSACRFNQLKSCTSDQALACQSNGKTLLSTWWNFPSLAFRHGLSDMVFHISTKFLSFQFRCHESNIFSPKRWDHSVASTPKEACCRSSGTETETWQKRQHLWQWSNDQTNSNKFNKSQACL